MLLGFPSGAAWSFAEVRMGDDRLSTHQSSRDRQESDGLVERPVSANSELRYAAEHTRRIADILQAASLSLTKTFDLDSILETLLDYLSDLVPYDSATIFLLEGESHLVARAARGYESWVDLEKAEIVGVVRFDTGDSPRHEALVATQQSLVIPDIQKDPSRQHVASSRHVRNWMGVPLVAGGRTIGLCSRDRTEPGFFTSEDVQLAEALAAQAAVGIQNALEGSVSCRVRRLDCALEVSVIDTGVGIAEAGYPTSLRIQASGRHVER
jgi:transcriptional regulator with GAF, ATPase, and Fis domain